MFPNAPYIKRQGEVDAWDNADFRAAIEATGKKQVILAGITTDVRVFHPLTLMLTFLIWTGSVGVRGFCSALAC